MCETSSVEERPTLCRFTARTAKPTVRWKRELPGVLPMVRFRPFFVTFDRIRTPRFYRLRPRVGRSSGVARPQVLLGVEMEGDELREELEHADRLRASNAVDLTGRGRAKRGSCPVEARLCGDLFIIE